MILRVNGVAQETQAGDLAALLEELGYGDTIVATAKNQIFVRAKDREKTPVDEGDDIEILAPRQGG